MKYIYLHGFASSAQSTKARFYADRFRERGLKLDIADLAPDGFERLTITGQLKAVRKAAGSRPCTLLGSSLGGYVAALYAARNPNVLRLVLLAPAFGFARRFPESLGVEKVRAWEQSGTMAVFHYGDQQERKLRFELLEDARRYEDYPDFEQSALILHGTEDNVVPAAASREFSAGRSNVKVVTVPSGHEMTDVLGVLWDETAKFLELE